MTDNLLQRAYDFVQECQFDKAIDAFLKAGAWDEAGGLLSLYAQDFYEMGWAKVVLGWLEMMGKDELKSRPYLLLLWGKILTDDYSRHDQSLEIFIEAEEIFRELGDKVGEFRAKVWRSVSYRLMGQGSKSLEVIEDSLEDLRAIEEMDERTLVWATRYHALSYALVGRREKALSILDQCLVKFTELGDTYHIGMCYHDMGFCLENLAKIGEAEFCYQSAVSIFRELGNKNNLVNSLNSLAYLLCLTKRYDEALENLNRCFQIAEEIESPFRRAIVLESMADVYRSQRDYLTAIEFYKRSNELAVLVKSWYLRACNEIHIGECYLALDESVKALDWANKAVGSATKNGLDTEYGKAMALRSRIYMSQGRDFAGLYKRSISCIYGDVLTQNREKLYLAQGLLFHDSRPLAAYDLLLEVLNFLTKDVVVLLSEVIVETRLLFEHFLFCPKTDYWVQLKIENLLKDCLIDWRGDALDLRIFGLGEPRIVVSNGGLSKCYNLRFRGKVTRYLPEFLMFLTLRGQGQHGLSVEEIGGYLWPSLGIERVKANVKQLLQVLKGEYLGRSCIEKIGRNRYRLVEGWSDVSAFLELFDRFQSSGECESLRRELKYLYIGDFLQGYLLSENGETLRAALKEKILAV